MTSQYKKSPIASHYKANILLQIVVLPNSREHVFFCLLFSCRTKPLLAGAGLFQNCVLQAGPGQTCPSNRTNHAEHDGKAACCSCKSKSAPRCGATLLNRYPNSPTRSRLSTWDGHAVAKRSIGIEPEIGAGGK